MGRIYKRGGRYYADYQTPGGKRIQRSLRTADKSVAKERLRQAELAATPQARGRRQRLSDAFDVLIKTTMHDRAKATREFYEEKARRVLETLGDPWIGDITRELLAGYIARRLSDDKDHGRAKPHTVQKELIVIRRALREAFELGVLPTMPAMPRFSAKYKPREVWLEPAEFEKLCEHLGHRPRARENKYSAKRRARRLEKRKPAYAMATKDERVLWASIAALAGASASEVESLQWADVKLDTGWLKLRGTKRETRERWVPIAPALRARLEAVPEDKRKGYVVKAWTSVRHGLHRAAKRAGLGKHVSPNDLRRTFASWLVQQHVPLLTVATLMGHSSTRMVEKVYGKLSKENLTDAIAALPQLATPPPDAARPLLAAAPDPVAPELAAARARIAELEQTVDAYEDASTPAFDDIARMCGVPHWDPGQVIRDVAMVINHGQTLALAARRTLERFAELGPLDFDALDLEPLRLAGEAFEALRTDPRLDTTVTDPVTERVSNAPTPDHHGDDTPAE